MASTWLDDMRVELAFGSGFSTLEADREWTDLSRRAKSEPGVEITYGRADDQPVAEPNGVSVTFENNDAALTPGNGSSPYFPHVKKSVPIRITYREPGMAGNFLSPNQASFETSVADWTAGGSVPPALAQSSTHVEDGAQALRITWGSGGSFPLAQTVIDDRVVANGLVKGRTYTAQARVWVPTGSPNVALVIPGLGVAGVGTSTATKDNFATIKITFTAKAVTHAVQVWPTGGAPTAGQLCWVDSVMVDEGPVVQPFTTLAPMIQTRVLAYVNEWPIAWPRGTGKESTTSITARSRRSRMGQTNKLPTSAIRAEYLADDPDGYWPMDEDDTVGVTLANGVFQQYFRDATNSTEIRRGNQLLGAWFETGAFKPTVRDGSPGPTDEQSLVKIPSTSDPANPDWRHYIGGSAVTKIGTNLSPMTGCTFEMVARVNPVSGGDTYIDLARVFAGPNINSDEFRFGLFDDGTNRYMYIAMQRRDSDGSVLEWPGWFVASTVEENAAATLRALDGEIHHYQIEVFEDTAILYFDGEWVAYSYFTTGVFTQPFRTIAIGARTLFANVWVGHAATYDVALAADLGHLHAAAATAATETLEERIIRVAGRAGVPADEITVETSWAQPLGPQAELGRSPAEILDEAAAGAAGVLHDDRNNHTVLRARNSRYNAPSAFTLDTTSEEIEPDLNLVMDDRYLVNTLEVSQIGNDNNPATLVDQDSVDAYGVYSKSLSVVTTLAYEAVASGYDQLYKFSEPRLRVTKVTVDVGDLTPAQREAVLAADIGTKFTIAGLPDQAPAPVMPLFYEGATESISRSGHFIAINTTPGDVYENVWIPDVNDTLDSGIVVGF